MHQTLQQKAIRNKNQNFNQLKNSNNKKLKIIAIDPQNLLDLIQVEKIKSS